MIVFERGSELGLITQHDHAHLAADLLSLWPSLTGHPRRGLLLRATELHDNGWREVDAAPPLDDRGRPHDFLSLPESLREEIWKRGTARFMASDPAASLLITQHALHLLRDSETEGRRDLLELLSCRREQLLERCPELAGSLAADYQNLRAADVLSLAMCDRWSTPFCCEIGTHRLCASLQDQVLTVEPLPLAAATRFAVPCRFIPHSAYPDLRSLGKVLAEASWKNLEFLVVGSRK